MTDWGILGIVWRERGKQKWRNFRVVFGENWEDNLIAMERQTLSSSTDLLVWLKSQDITVPARTEGRRKEHCERYTAFRLLATLANNFQYPLKILHQDRPDFLLHSGDKKIGIEVTEAVPEELAATDAMAEAMGIESTLFMDHFKQGTPKRTAKERKELLKNQPLGVGWGSGGISKEWILSIIDCIKAKTMDLKKPGFNLYDLNCLLVYDNLFLAFADIRELASSLSSELKSYWCSENRYNEIFIESGNQLVHLKPNGWNCKAINDL